MISKGYANTLQSLIGTMVKTTSVDVRVRINVSQEVGYGEDEFIWTNWETYECGLDSVDQFNIDDFPFGGMATGDAIIMFPHDSRIKRFADRSDVVEFEVKFGGNLYSTSTQLQEYGYLKENFMHYILSVST